LDQRLQESLEEFDGALMKEQEALAKRREETAADTAAARDSGGSASSSGSYGEHGESGSYGSSGSYGDRGSSGEQATSSSAGGTETTGGSRDVASAGGSQPRSTGGPSGTPPPAGIPDGADDDIVARQLREAAMNEDDPELREKLWEEYRVYKTGKRSTAGSPTAKPANEAEQTDERQDASEEQSGDDE
jgi:hypothetical protein